MSDKSCGKCAYNFLIPDKCITCRVLTEIDWENSIIVGEIKRNFITKKDFKKQQKELKKSFRGLQRAKYHGF